MRDEEETYRTHIDDKLELILGQTTKTNGRVTKIERNILVIGTALAVVIVLKFPELAVLIKLI